MNNKLIKFKLKCKSLDKIIDEEGNQYQPKDLLRSRWWDIYNNLRFLLEHGRMGTYGMYYPYAKLFISDELVTEEKIKEVLNADIK